MARPRCVTPAYRKHKQSGQAVVTLTDPSRSRRDILLGQHGTKESRLEYARVLAEWEMSGRTLPSSEASPDLTVNELLLRFWHHAVQHYRHADGTPTSELEEYRSAFRPLKRIYGHTPAKDFGPLALKAVRQTIVDGSYLTLAEKTKRQKNGLKLDCSRAVANRRAGRVRRVFKWAVENEMVPPSVFLWRRDRVYARLDRQGLRRAARAGSRQHHQDQIRTARG